jgi:hypothetical protein
MDPASLSLFCDFDSIRRLPVAIVVNSSLGCLRFDGVVDGCSISQQPGGLSTSLIVKHNFTFLNEVYPRVLGLSAGATNYFAINQTLNVDITQNTGGAGNMLAQMSPNPNYGLTAVSTSKPIIDYIVQICIAQVESQISSPLVFNTQNSNLNSDQGNANFNPVLSAALSEVLTASQLNAQKLGPFILALLGEINTSFTENFILQAGFGGSQDTGNDTTNLVGTASLPCFASNIMTGITNMEDTLFHNLLREINSYGCVLVVGNGTAFVIPEAQYLNIIKGQALYNGQHSNQNNIALPADYIDFSFNDHGENTIKGVYAVQDGTGDVCSYPKNSTGVINGCYIDPNPNVMGNIVLKTLPPLASSYISYAAAFGAAGILSQMTADKKATAAAPNPTFIGGKMDTASLLASHMLTQVQANNTIYNPLKAYMSQWAQIEYCKIKYGDRTGSITLPFNNKWTPGAPGSVYTRFPGTYVDFYVTDVVHNFRIQAPHQGDATTNVSFAGGRPGASVNVGLDTISLYSYGYAESQQFCAAFIQDISNTAAPVLPTVNFPSN